MPKLNATPVPDPHHDIDLCDGKFDRTKAPELAAAFDQFKRENGKHLCVFFHGGLVSREAALTTAHDLVKDYVGAGAYPLFFIWNSDLITVIRSWMHEVGSNAAFIDLASDGVQAVGAKMNLALGLRPDKGLPASPPTSLKDVAKAAKTFDRTWAKRSGQHLGVTQGELDDFAKRLLEAWKFLPKGKRRLTKTLLRGHHNPLSRIIERFNAHRDHDLYTTIVEELLLAIFGDDEDNPAVKAWNSMKVFIDHAFKPNAKMYGGTAFLKGLFDVWKPDMRLTLIGHSAGSIYIQRLLEALAQAPDKPASIKAEVVFLAPAISFERMAAGLESVRPFISRFRMFGLNSAREAGYPEVPGYDKSLLYLVSALCEQDPLSDKPLVGMERYWSGTKPYVLPEIKPISDWVPIEQREWSPSDERDGYRTNADRHGGFPEDPLTKQSMKYILENGFDTRAKRVTRMKKRRAR